MKNPIATLKMKNGKEITIELYPQFSPNAVNSFINLANKGTFDNKDVKRIVPGFVLQPTYDEFVESDDYRYELDGEFEANGFDGGKPFEKWTVALAGDGVKYTSGSCYYITLSDEAAKKLNGKYTTIGKVIDGFEEVERIENVKTAPVECGLEGVEVNLPIIPETIESIRVETFGIDYPKPQIARYV
ncbi:MAG: peptidylprolyl isomerase [Oscillospiraceae bacterium]